MRRIVPLLALFLASCAAVDGLGLKPGVANEGQVRSTLGEPALEIRNSDGTRRLAYPRGPFGNQTYMVHLGGDGLLQSIQPVLNDNNFYRIQPGWTRDDVLDLIGPPLETGEFPRLGQIAWDYRYQDTWGYIAIFSVMLDRDGRVVGKANRRLERSPFGR
jgi:hypothetical protein